MNTVHTTNENGAKARRKRWIIGLSIVALLLAYMIAGECIRDYKRFNKADRLATGHVVEVDPGEPGDPNPYDGDSGRPPASQYEFKVNRRTYDGWTEDELAPGDQILVRYNSSDPSFNHAQDVNERFWRRHGSFGLILIFVSVLVSLVKTIRDKDQPEYP